MDLLHKKLGDAVTPEEMRMEFIKAARDEPLIYQAFNQADYLGLSGEDKYTVLAYHSMRQFQTMRELVIEREMISPAPPIVMVEKRDKGE